MDATEKCALIREMVDRLVLAERSCTGWTDEIISSTTKCERDRATEMLNRATDRKTALWRDFDKTLEELMHG